MPLACLCSQQADLTYYSQQSICDEQQRRCRTSRSAMRRPYTSSKQQRGLTQSDYESHKTATDAATAKALVV